MKAGLAVILVSVTSTLMFAQQEKSAGDKPAQPAMPDAAAMQEYIKSMQPGDAHKHLEAFVGKWNTVTKMWMAGPKGPATESPGTSEVKWVLGNRFLMEEHKGQMMGQPYEGIGMTGYDNYRNMYVSTWTNNMSTAILTMTGMRHPETGVFTYYGEMDEPMMKVTGRTVKYFGKFEGKDKFVFSIIDLHAGDDYKVVEITYTRAK